VLRLLGVREWALAPAMGLAVLAVASVWGAAFGAPSWVSGVLLAALVAVGVQRLDLRKNRRLLAVLAAAALLPLLLLGVAFAGIEVPVSNHDGAFHVETIEALRHGVQPPMWYPIGFHTSVAALLALTPWIDSARGTLEVAQGLAILTPLCVFGLGISLGVRPMVAATASVIQAITFLFPYDYQLWGGWPLGMGILLALGLWSVALRWTAQPSVRLAVLGGLLAGAIVLTHGTEVYTGLLGLLVIAAVRARQVDLRALAPHLAVAIGLAAILAGPYLPSLFGWASTGAATAVASANLDYALANPEMQGKADWLQFALGVTGASALVDLPIRLALLAAGLWYRPARTLVALWLVFTVLLFAVDFLSIALLDRIFILTFPWLVDHRPRQIAVILASLIEAGGLAAGWSVVQGWRPRLALHPHAWRRVALAAALIVGLTAESGAVSIYKRLAQGIYEQNLYSADDVAAMAWLREHVGPDEIVLNNRSSDAGIWAPYKADVTILLPRNATSAMAQVREPIVENVLNLGAAPSAGAAACALGVNYLYRGALAWTEDEPTNMPTRLELDQAVDLQAVFRSGQAVVFRIKHAC
jgi:hypothetical protein